MERVAETQNVVRIVRGKPDAHETAALLALLTARLSARLGLEGEPEPPAPTWQPFTGHAESGWGRAS
ncbi:MULTISPECIES: acyl-CoA carboxylase epsilon subunit [unclassified Streptomyces]|uniref:acyl-CoA carboxylase epsilon subunit n=1 Tax=unclassified Streptomyces TaxID=2593676 RepID=UPI002E186A38|nr:MULTISPECIES: acyl-CoA carboxylase epsilon subunit [unclassified Streptomyces]